MGRYDDYLRWLYRGGQPNWFAKLQNRLSAVAFSAGIMPSRVGTLVVRGRCSGYPVSFPVVIATFEGGRYLVSMLGAGANWVRNVEADGGRAELCHGRHERIHLVEIDAAGRAPILRRYLELAPGARPHFSVDRRAPLDEFEQIAAEYPVFRIEPRADAA
jgi:hypothetical protein